jgi:hypothetical protein
VIRLTPVAIRPILTPKAYSITVAGKAIIPLMQNPVNNTESIDAKVHKTMGITYSTSLKLVHDE